MFRFFFGWQEQINKFYPNLFKKGSGSSGGFKIPEELQWYQLCHQMIEKLNTTEEGFWEMNYINTLNWVSYFDLLAKEEKKQMDKLNKKR